MNYKEIKYRLFEKGLTYTQFINGTIEEIAKQKLSEISEKENGKFKYKVLNLQRSTRISRTYNVSDKMKDIITEITEPELWMVITENWCGDSAQCLPYIDAFARENTFINLQIILRDSNPDIMDQYLTNGTRSIPKVISFNDDGEELFRWGPRPQAAIELINNWKLEGLEKNQWTEKLHLWYSKNNSYEMEKDFAVLIKKGVAAH